MKLEKFDYNLPDKLIAQEPARPRDHSRLMVLNRKNGRIYHHHFYEIGKFLKSGDILVLNNSKVFPARLYGRKSSGGKIEVLLCQNISKERWKVIASGLKKKNEGQKLYFDQDLIAELEDHLGNGLWQIKFNFSSEELKRKIFKLGKTPTPPYIKKETDLETYQTIYAKIEGSVAAPTAGFHFTKRLMNELKNKGVRFEFITLHIGLGTFQPVRASQIEKHKMHSEWAILSASVAQRLNRAKKDGRRIISVGTTTTRILEDFCNRDGTLRSGKKEISLFIYPGYKFRFIDALITNFHLPKSTLVMLASAFAGKEFIFRAYKEAIRKGYRFYSFGDAMLIL